MTRGTRSLGELLGVRPHERGRVGLVAALFALLEAGRILGEVGVETLVQGRFGPAGLPGVLPWLYMALGALGVGVALAYGAALGRVGRRPLFVGVLGIAAGGMVLGWLALPGGSDAVLVGLWLGVALVGTLLMTIIWTLAGAVFDARQARRVFPLLTAAAIAGSFAGSLAAGPLTASLGAADLVVIEASALVIAIPLVMVVVGRTRAAPGRPSGGGVLHGMRGGLDEVLASRLLRRIAVCYVLLAVLMFSVQYPFTVSVATALPTDAERATTLGILSAAVTATSFLVSVLVAGRLYARFGISVGALLLPLVYLAGFGLWLVWFTFPTALIVRFGQQVTQRGVSNASWSAFYTVVPGHRRAQVIGFMDGIPGQLGTVLSGVLLLAASRTLAPDVVSWLGFTTAAVTVVLVVGIRRGYGRSLVAALRAGVGERLLEGGPGLAGMLGDPSVVPALTDALGSPEPGVREVAAQLLDEGGRIDATARAALVAATGDPDARVRVAAIRALARSGDLPDVAMSDADRDAAAGQPDISALIADQDPRVRAAALVADGRGDTGVLLRLAADAHAAVRATAIAALAPEGATSLPPWAREVALQALEDRSGRVRSAAAVVLGQDDPAIPELLRMVTDGTPPGSLAALDALARHTARDGLDPVVRDRLLGHTGGELSRIATLRVARRELDDDPDPIVRFLCRVLLAREDAALADVLGALAVLGAPDASGPVRRCLASPDPEVRAQAIEAVESLADPRLARRVSALLDDPTPQRHDGPGRAAVLDSLAHDDDPWLRRLAVACRERSPVAGATRTMTELQTMLALRRVPLFEGLQPEDLQRIAAYAVERSYTPGEVLMAEGEPGDELVVLLDGSVRVERIEPDGSARFIRAYHAGEHIGELAVLRERPRAATVTADAEGAQGLVVPGVGLRDILRERPDAAMAMLATLAERLGTQ
jgi:HEAT repeat protein